MVKTNPQTKPYKRLTKGRINKLIDQVRRALETKTSDEDQIERILDNLHKFIIEDCRDRSNEKQSKGGGSSIFIPNPKDPQTYDGNKGVVVQTKGASQVSDTHKGKG